MPARALALAATAVALWPASALAGPESSLVFNCHPDRVCKSDPAGTRVDVLIPSRDLDHDALSASSDGARLSYRDHGQLFTSAIDGTGLLSLEPEDVQQSVISPAGDRVAFVRLEEIGDLLTPVLWTIRTDGTDRRRIGPNLANPAWAGDRIVATRITGAGGSDPRGAAVCFVDEAAGACGQVITPSSGWSFMSPGAVSPDGRYVAVYGGTPNISFPESIDDKAIHVFATATAKHVGKRRVSGAYEVAWSPDGRALAWTDSRLWVGAAPPKGNETAYAVGAEVTSFSWTGRMGQKSPRLRLTKATVRGRRLTIQATLASKASDPVRVEVNGLYLDDAQIWPGWVVTARRGRVTLTRRLTADQRAKVREHCRAEVAFPGNADYGWGYDHSAIRGCRS